MKLIDISHSITHGLITYKGLPAPIICDYLSREESRNHYDGETFHIGKVEMVVNTGTYIDCPFHRYEDGEEFTHIDLNRLVNLEAVIVRVPFDASKEIGVKHFQDVDVNGKAVLIHTGWDAFWEQEKYFEYNPFLSVDAARYLVENKALLVGIDSLNIDDTRSKSRPVHTSLLGNNILIIEHLCNLDQVPDNQLIKVSAAPPKIEGVGSFPVRVYVEVS